MSSPSRVRIGTALLVVAALLVGLSGFLPPGHPQTHYGEFVSYASMVGEAVAAGIWDAGTLFLLNLAVACALPAVGGAALLAGALLGRGRLAVRASFLLEGLFLGGAAGVLWISFALNLIERGSDPRLRLAFGGGAAVMTLVLALDVLLFRRAVRRPDGRADALHVVPLILLAIGGLAAGTVMWGSEQWHAADYLAVGAGGAAGLAGLLLREWGHSSFRRK